VYIERGLNAAENKPKSNTAGRKAEYQEGITGRVAHGRN
jgi:hypothetical protein